MDPILEEMERKLAWRVEARERLKQLEELAGPDITGIVRAAVWTAVLFHSGAKSPEEKFAKAYRSAMQSYRIRSRRKGRD